jgi:class 3 adenylate cyclase
MIWLQNTIRTLNPTVVLEGSPWADEWYDSQKHQFLKSVRVVLPAIAIVYLLHYPLFDKPNNLQPQESWLLFRASAAGIIFFATALYYTKLTATQWYKLPAMLVLGLMCYSQAVVTLNYPAAPWLYPFVFLIGSTLLLKLDILKSIIFASLTTLSFISVLEASGTDRGTLISAASVTLISIGILRSTYGFEISNFLLNKENAEKQQENLDLQREFSDRIKSFIPSVIARRIQFQVDKNHLSVSEASLNVLQPRKLEVSCLFSDIRGFTQGSKDLDNFISESVLPEVKAASDRIEEYDGIPRKIGDLIFAYYDDLDVQKNAIRAVLSGIELSALNQAMNETLTSVEINRYILVASGNAIVGNLGGTDSSVEITALGSPVNFLSRLDDATKQAALANLLNLGDLVLCQRTTEVLTALGLATRFQEVSVPDLGIEIRDFPETKCLSIVEPTDTLKAELVSHLIYLDQL